MEWNLSKMELGSFYCRRVTSRLELLSQVITLLPPSMNTSLPSSKANFKEFSTNNYGDRNATYNNSTVNNVYNDSPGPPRSGIDILGDSISRTALHSSSSPRTGVLEGTRVGIIEELSRWIEDSSKKHRSCWVHGGAGVGKSAVAQTICEVSRRKSQLAASFFFWRNDAQRSTLDYLFPTIAHQLATTPELEKAGLTPFIDGAVRQSTNGLEEMNLEGQFQTLIHRPCAQIDAKRWKTLPRLVVIDGFDECMGGFGATSPSRAQEALLSIIRNATSADPPLPLNFMIFSRPERTILDFFQNILPHRLVDMRSFNSEADNDVRKYLKKEFANLSDSQPDIMLAGPWPGERAVEKLVGKADGHFIYVVTVMKYITVNNPSLADLQERLDIVLHTEETTTHPDLSDLDQLYHAILRRFGSGDLHKQRLVPVLQLMITPHPKELSADTRRSRSHNLIAALLKIDLAQCYAFLSQLRSVLHVPQLGQTGDVSILHASFSDFLGESQRSHEYHVEPLSEISYLDYFSCCLLSILGRHIRQYRGGERTDIADRSLEMWSLNPWSMVAGLLTSSERNYTPSEELITAITDFDLYGYSNMILDQEYSKEAFGRLKSSDWSSLTSRIHTPSRYGGLSVRNSDIDRWYNGKHWGFMANRQEFYTHLFFMLINNVICLQGICNPLKSPGEDSDAHLRYDQLNQFFEGDWLVVLPKSGRNRKISLSRLGCIALLASSSLPRGIPHDMAELARLLSPTTKDHWGIVSPLKILPHREIARASMEGNGGKFEVCFVSSRQRLQLAEEVAQTIRNEGALSTGTLDNLIVKTLTGTSIKTSQTNYDAGEGHGKRASGLRIFRAFSRVFS
ncbi:hypothetical protein PM082_014517 [Marasmius tenuissimus]|nr:hypothetical protein PM082_014517 [Marasmius tenuissimus]